jgi:hypothetical protein
MFRLTVTEFENLKSHIATSSWRGRRELPYAFTEHGVLMLSSVLFCNLILKVTLLGAIFFLNIEGFISGYYFLQPGTGDIIVAN